MKVITQNIQKVLTGLRVMVIDDVTDCRDVVNLYLNQMGAKVKAVASANDALSVISNFQPELIISDIYMPEQDGYWLIEQLNRLNAKSNHKILTIALTAAAKEVDKEQLLAAGYDGYLAKPFMFEDLNKLIARLIIES